MINFIQVSVVRHVHAQFQQEKILELDAGGGKTHKIKNVDYT
jgi:hypothetical protein